MENKFIIFEGLDNVGKTTQTKKLLKYLIGSPTYVIHFSGIPGINTEEARNYSYKLYHDMFILMHEAYSNNRNLIFDRSHIGEYVYSPIYRNYSGDYIFDIEDKFKNKDFFKHIYLFTFIDRPENVLVREDGKSFSVNIETKKKEIALFYEATNKSRITHKQIIDIDNTSIDQIHEYVKNILQI